VINSKVIQLEKLYKWTLKKKRKLPFHL
jgi:hypothetical protein